MISILSGGDFERYKRKSGKYDKGDPKLGKYFRNTLLFKEWYTEAEDKLHWFDLQ